MASSNAIEIGKEDLPGIYYTASQSSQTAQKTFTKLIKINIFLLLILAVISAINISSIKVEYQHYIPLSSAILMLLSIFITSAIEAGKFEKKWYDGRAIAESLKTLSWKFMMKSDPFYDLKKEDAEKLFLSEFKDIMHAIKPSGAILGENAHANEHQLTDKMKEVWASNLETRKETYSKYRIGNQIDWYGKKAKENTDSVSIFFWTTIVLQFLTIVSAFYMVNLPNAGFNPTGLVATAVATIMTWMQVKQFRNLSESYGVTKSELRIIKDTIPTIKNPIDFSEFVKDSESAVSREHTLWRARRSAQ